MPNLTELYQFPSPLPSELADGPDGIQSLAERIEEVLSTQFGRAITTDTAEIGFVGTSTTGDPLKANLKGVRSGNWAVNGALSATGNASIDGNVISGKAGQATIGMLRAFQFYSSANYEARVYTQNGNLYVVLYNGATLINYFYLTPTGQFLVVHGGQARPLPYATWLGASKAVHTNDVLVNVSVNLPAGRFSVTPLALLSQHDTTSHLLGTLNTTDKNGVDFQSRQYQNVAVNNSVFVRVHAIQMLPSNPEGRVETQAIPKAIEGVPVVETRSVCHVSGCENQDAPVVRMQAADSQITCGPCGQPVTDVTR